MRTCEICGHEFELTKDNHYIVRDNETTGIVTVGRHDEVQMYDAVDCPNCGCQIILCKRLRPFTEIIIDESIEDEAKESEPQDGHISSSEDDEDVCQGPDNCWDDCSTCDIKKKIENDDLADIKKKIEEAGE